MGGMDSSPPDPNSIPLAAPAPDAAGPPPRRGRARRWLAGVAVLIAGVGIWQYPSIKGQAEAGSAYAARIGCSCRYVQGRSLNSCTTDFEPGMEMVSVDDDAEAKAVTGSVPLIASRTARFKGASGCILDPAG